MLEPVTVIQTEPLPASISLIAGNISWDLILSTLRIDRQSPLPFYQASILNGKQQPCSVVFQLAHMQQPSFSHQNKEESILTSA